MEDLVHRPIGDLLEEILDRGPGAFPRYAGAYRAGPRNYRISVLLGGLCLGEKAEEELRDRLTSRDSPEKQQLLLALGEMGHPLAEGYLARVLRERPSHEAMAAALSGLGRIRGAKSLPLIVEALNHPSLFQAACDALVLYAGREAAEALYQKLSEFQAFRALAHLGASVARDEFLQGLERGEPWDAEAARGLGNLADPLLASALVPHIPSHDSALARAAFEAYARLGAPQGPGPLLEAASNGLEPWMIPALNGVENPEVHRFVVERLESHAPRGLLGRLFRRRARSTVDHQAIYRCLRGARAPEVVERLVVRLRNEENPAQLRELLSNRGLREDERYAAEVAGVWNRGGLVAAYLAARVLLQLPTGEFLGEALDCLRRPSFVPLEEAPASADPERLLESYAADNNPCLLVGGFLDSGIVDLASVEEALRARFAGQARPPPSPPAARFTEPGEQGIVEFLTALTESNPSKAEPLCRLWNLLAQEEDRGDSLLDLFLSWTGVQRGGIQRAVVQGFPSALGRFIQGKTDKHLAELDALAEHLPREGSLARPLGEAVERARQALMAECRDMALLLEGSQQGDMVLIEELP